MHARASKAPYHQMRVKESTKSLKICQNYRVTIGVKEVFHVYLL